VPLLTIYGDYRNDQREPSIATATGLSEAKRVAIAIGGGKRPEAYEF
jgi:hypothetical protein